MIFWVLMCWNISLKYIFKKLLFNWNLFSNNCRFPCSCNALVLFALSPIHFVQFPQMITLCKTMLYYHNENITISTIHHLTFPQFYLYSCVCAYLVLYNCVILCRFVYPPSQGSFVLSTCISLSPQIPPRCQPCFLATIDLFSISKIVSFQKCFINEIMLYMIFETVFFFIHHNSPEMLL